MVILVRIEKVNYSSGTCLREVAALQCLVLCYPFGAMEAGCFIEVAALYSDHCRQVLLYNHLLHICEAARMMLTTPSLILPLPPHVLWNK